MADPPLPFDVEGPVKAEVYLVWLADGSIRLGGPDGPRAWELEVGAGEHPVEAVDRIVRDVVGEPLLVHSTSWRRDRDAVVLSFLVVVDPALVAGQPSVERRSRGPRPLVRPGRAGGDRDEPGPRACLAPPRLAGGG